MSWCSKGDRVDQDIFDAMTEFIAQMMQRGERLAERFDVPVSCVKALRRVDASVSMKALGQLLHCDPSFVTMIADALERRGLAKREPGTVDRRIKNLVLTERGLEVKSALDQEMLGMMPWARALSLEEREQFLGLLRKMNLTLSGPTGATAMGEVTGSTSTTTASTTTGGTTTASSTTASTTSTEMPAVS